MASTNDQRALLQRARRHLDEWRYVARERTSDEMFDGDDAVLSEAELAELDEIDSRLTQQSGEGIWGSDEYGIVENGASGNDSGFRVVCTSHPEIPYEGYRGLQSLDEATREEFNDLLWDYCQRVAEHIQEQLDSFVREHDPEAESL